MDQKKIFLFYKMAEKRAHTRKLGKLHFKNGNAKKEDQ